MASGSDSEWITVSGSAEGFAQHVTARGHGLSSDEPLDDGGTDTGPTPYDLLLAGLGACTSMTVSMYARRKKWTLSSVTVRLRHQKIHAKDCERCEREEGHLDRIEREITLDGELSEAQRAELLSIANRCPVHRTLTSPINIVTRLK